MTRRALTLVMSAVFLVVLVIASQYIKVPYVILLPGPVTDTLGSVPAGDTTTGQAGGPVIEISGTTTQPTSGHLYLTTVEELPGDCNVHPTLWEAVRAWFSKTQTVEPHQVECPPNQSSQAVQQQSENEMSESQVHAITAALTELGYKSSGNRVTVGSVEQAAPAAKVLEPGDIIEAINGKAIRTITQLRSAVRTTGPAKPITVTILRDAKRLTESTMTIRGAGGVALIGISPINAPTFGGIGVSIGISPDAIGGPSAGTALALGIIDKLTPGGITGGRTIAGTGTVSPLGKVGPIGGIQQKIAAAVAAHATVFFAPASECPDAKAAAPSSLTVVSIKTLSQAVASLKAIKAGSNDFTRC